MWAQLPAEGRESYNKAARADRERYDQEVKQHQARFPLVSCEERGVLSCKERGTGRLVSAVRWCQFNACLRLFEVARLPATSPTHF